MFERRAYIEDSKMYNQALILLHYSVCIVLSLHVHGSEMVDGARYGVIVIILSCVLWSVGQPIVKMEYFFHTSAVRKRFILSKAERLKILYTARWHGRPIDTLWIFC